MQLAQKKIEEELKEKALIAEQERAAKLAETQAEKDMQELLDAIQTAQIARSKENTDAQIAYEKERAAIERSKQEAYAETVERIMKSISPDLISALESQSKSDLLKEGMKSMSPYALAGNMSIPDTVNKLLRGTPLEDVITNKNLNMFNPPSTTTKTK